MPLGYRKFWQGTQRVSDSSILGSRTINNLRVESSYDLDSQTVTFSTSMKSFTYNGITHVLQISFVDVTPDQIIQDDLDANRDRNNGQIIPIPILYKNNMKVRCSCPSFRFTGSEAAINYSAFIGRNYTPWIPRKTDRPPRNPRNIPILCKHLITFITYLVDNRYVVTHHL